MLGAGTADLIRNESYFFTTLEAGIERARPSQAWNHFANTPGDVIAEQYGFEGQRACVVGGLFVEHHRASARRWTPSAWDVSTRSIAGGTDALARLTYSGFNALRLMDPRPCRPFDRSRAGMNMGEGAGMLVLEDMDRARRRGARIYGGAGRLQPGLRGLPSDGAAARWASGRRRRAQGAGRRRVDAAEVDHVNAHGTATPQNDQAEAKGVPQHLRRSRRATAGHLAQVDDWPLPGRGRRARGRHRGVDRRARHHPADDQLSRRPIPNARSTWWRTWRVRRRVRCAVSTSLAFGGNDSALVMSGRSEDSDQELIS